jgi:hypothetical protein
MVFAPPPPSTKSQPPKPQPTKPQPTKPQPTKPPTPETPVRATPAKPRVVTVLLYRAPGAQAGNEPLPAFEVRGVVPPPPARLRRDEPRRPATVDLVKEENAAQPRREEIDLTHDAGGDMDQGEAGASDPVEHGSAPGRAGRSDNPESRERRQD